MDTTLTSIKIKSSLYLQILLSIHPYFYTFYWLATLAMLIYKAMVFQFSNYVYALEVSALFPWIVMEISRLFLGSRGNKMEELPSTLIYLGLSVLSFVVFIYYMFLQTYVLLFDIIIGAIALFFVGLQIITGIQLVFNLTGHVVGGGADTKPKSPPSQQNTIASLNNSSKDTSILATSPIPATADPAAATSPTTGTRLENIASVSELSIDKLAKPEQTNQKAV